MYWNTLLTRPMYTYRMIIDATKFIGAEVYSLIHQHGYSVEKGITRGMSDKSKELRTGLYTVSFAFKLFRNEQGESLSGKKLLTVLPEEEDDEAKAERKYLESSRMNANLVFGGSDDAKVFDLPINDKLFRSKYKQIIKDTREVYYERELLFNFFRSYTISDEERKHIWKIRIGNRLGITKDLYDSLCMRLELEGIKKKDSKLISDDLFRTLPNYGSTKIGETMYEKLHHILSLFQLYRPDIGYVQGMSFIVVMLYYFYDEYETFAIFSNLIITKPLIFACYDFDIETVLR